MFIKNYRKISDSQWENTRNKKIFSHNQFLGTRFGKDHFYIDQNSALERFNIFNKNYGTLTGKKVLVQNEEINSFCDSSLSIDNLYKKKALIIGGGPTTNLVNWQNLDFDYKFACNNFYKNPFLNSIKIDFLSFAPFMNLTEKNTALHEYLKKYRPTIGIEPEHTKPKEIEQMVDFISKYNRDILFYQTKYCSPIGMSTRQVALASILGASEVYMVGLDLFSDHTTKHSYEKNKDMPRWRVTYGQEFQERQIIIFWDYLSKLSANYGTKFYNLSEGMKENHMTFASKVFSPLPQEIREKIK